jgi:hypothetical protein
MKVSYGEGLANHTGPRSCGGGRDGGIEASTGKGTGPVYPANELFGMPML